jgi:hypothetical protein
MMAQILKEITLINYNHHSNKIIKQVLKPKRINKIILIKN